MLTKRLTSFEKRFMLTMLFYDLEREDVLAALAYAARMIAGEEIGVYA
jgi:hypothetical protein